MAIYVYVSATRELLTFSADLEICWTASAECAKGRGFEMYLQEQIFQVNTQIVHFNKKLQSTNTITTFNQQKNSTDPLFLSSTTNDAIHHIKSYQPQSSNWQL